MALSTNARRLLDIRQGRARPWMDWVMHVHMLSVPSFGFQVDPEQLPNMPRAHSMRSSAMLALCMPSQLPARKRTKLSSGKFRSDMPAAARLAASRSLQPARLSCSKRSAAWQRACVPHSRACVPHSRACHCILVRSTSKGRAPLLNLLDMYVSREATHCAHLTLPALGRVQDQDGGTASLLEMQMA